MAGRVMDVDNGVVTKMHNLGDRVIVERESYNIGAILEANKRQLNDVDTSKRMGDMVHVGRIDAVVLQKWMSEDGINYLAKENQGLLLKKLELRDNRLFKTHPGKFA
jgi:hypothetical protein